MMASTTTPVVSGAGRGDFAIQPAYFTSSLFVHPLRQDIQILIQEFDKRRNAQSDSETKPFAIFKNIWVEQGWSWLHLKILEPRGRESFLKVVMRLFLEQATSSDQLIGRVVGLMGLYTFYATQPTTFVPKVSLIVHVSIPIDQYEGLFGLPHALEGDMLVLKPTMTYVLKWLVERNVFTVIPASHLHAGTPRVLPREIVCTDVNAAVSDADGASDGSRKKVGRPSKAEKQQRGKAALVNLEKWLEKGSYPLHESNAGARNYYRSNGRNEEEQTTHILLSQRPVMSVEAYRKAKEEMFSQIPATLEQTTGPIEGASRRVLARLKEIDAVAAERGMEIGTEGGESSGLGRVEKAMDEGSQRGLLGLIDGAGLLPVNTD